MEGLWSQWRDFDKAKLRPSPVAIHSFMFAIASPPFSLFLSVHSPRSSLSLQRMDPEGPRVLGADACNRTRGTAVLSRTLGFRYGFSENSSSLLSCASLSQ